MNIAVRKSHKQFYEVLWVIISVFISQFLSLSRIIVSPLPTSSCCFFGICLPHMSCHFFVNYFILHSAVSSFTDDALIDAAKNNDFSKVTALLG